MPPTAANRAAQKIKITKKKNRRAKAASVKRNQIRALPAIPKLILDANYVNPVTLEFPRGTVVYEIQNKTTGRKNYYNKATFRKLITRFKNDYNLLMANPKSPIPGARNPVTRGAIYPRNVRRVTVKPKSRSVAARKIQSAVRKHLKKKKSVKK